MEDSMKQHIGIVKPTILQTELDAALGANLFSVDREMYQGVLSTFVEYNDGLSQLIIDQAQQIITQQLELSLAGIKKQMTEKIAQVANKSIQRRGFSATLEWNAQQAQTWLSNQVLPVPAIILETAIQNSVNNTQAAQMILDELSAYTYFLNTVESIKQRVLLEINNSTDYVQVKVKTQDGIFELAALEKAD